MKAIVDCNSFYAACERLFRPDLREKPVAVLSNNDGCIISRSDEAKALGISMAGPYYQHRALIEAHGVAVFSSNYYLYGDMSRRVMETLRCHCPSVEVYSVDESFVDLSGISSSELFSFAAFLKQRTEEWTGIPVSIGVAPTKVLSKVANRLAKKDKAGTKGVMVLTSEEEQREALQKTAVEDLWGIGGAYAKKLRMYNINNGWDLRNRSEAWARKNLGGVTGERLLRELRGEPCIDLKDQLETKKMIGTSRMFGRQVSTLTEIREAVAAYISRAAEKLRRQQGAASEISVFLVCQNRSTSAEYQPVSSSRWTSLPMATSLTQVLISYALPLVDALFVPGNRYIKAGVLLGGILPDRALQENMFGQLPREEMKKLMAAVDNVNFSMQSDTVSFAATGTARQWKMRQDMRSPRYTTRWEELRQVT